MPCISLFISVPVSLIYVIYDWCTRCTTNVCDVQLMYAIYNHVCHVSHFSYLSQWALYMWYMTDVCDVQPMYAMYNRSTRCTTDVHDVWLMYAMSNWCMQYITIYAMYLTFYICTSEPYICDIWLICMMYDWCTWCMTDVRDVQLMCAIYNHVCHVSHFLNLSWWP